MKLVTLLLLLPVAVAFGGEGNRLARSGDSAGASPSQPRPNILFLLTDDQRWDALSLAGHPAMDGRRCGFARLLSGGEHSKLPRRTSRPSSRLALEKGSRCASPLGGVSFNITSLKKIITLSASTASPRSDHL